MSRVISTDGHVASGLDGVLACESAITLVDGAEGELFFRGYDVLDFAEQADYLAVVHLLWHGRWPTPDQQVAFDQEVRSRSVLCPRTRACPRLGKWAIRTRPCF